MSIIIVLIELLATIIIGPICYFAIGWISGFFIKIFFGRLFISGLALLGISMTIDQIPLLCGVISVIASFFVSGHIEQISNEDDDEESF